MSALDKLNKLNKTLAKTEKVEKKSDRPEMPVPPLAKAAFARLIPAQQILKLAEKRVEIENSIVSEEMLSVYAEILYTQGSRPTNPRLKVEKNGRPDMSGLYQVQERFKLNYEKGDAPVSERLQTALVKAGFSLTMAEKIVENEINCEPMTVLRPLNELANGTKLEKSAASKIIDLVFGEPATPLTEEEKAVSVKIIDVVEVRDGILERVKQYCDNPTQLKMLFKVIVPVNFVSHAKYAESDTPEVQVQRLAEEAKQLVIGTKLEK